MKRKRVLRDILIMAAFAFMVMCAGTMRVQAIEMVSNLEKDSSLEEITYTFDFVTWGTKMVKPKGYGSGYVGSGSVVYDGYRLCAYKFSVEATDTSSADCYLTVYMYNSNGFQLLSSSLSNIKKYATSSTGITTYGYVNLSSGEFDYEEPTTYSYLTGEFKWDDVSDYNTDEHVGKLATNMPIFSSKEQAFAFMNGEITEKEAENYESDLCNIKYDLEIPQELTVTYEDGVFDEHKYAMNWKQTDENYKDWQTEFYIYMDLEGYAGILGIKLGELYEFTDRFLYSEAIDTYKLKYILDCNRNVYCDALDKVLEQIYNEVTTLTSTYPTCFKIYIRNHYFDGEYKHYSNWVYVEIDYDFISGEESVTVIEINGSVKDTPGASTPSTDISGDVNSESQYDGTVDAVVQNSSTDILSWVSDGFGLIGDDGIVSMMADAFDYVPSFVWTLVGAGIAIAVAIGVYKLVF